MNRGELRDLVLYWLDDLQGGYFTETQVNTWLNNAQQEVQKRLIKASQNYYLKCQQTTLVVNQEKYALPGDFKKLHRLEIINSGTYPNLETTQIVPITTNQQDLVPGQVGTPCFYSLRKNSIILYPIPDTAKTMRLYYSYAVVAMTQDADIPDVPDTYHQLIALLAAEDGFLKDGRRNDLLVKKIAEYQEHMDSDANERQQDTTRQVVTTEVNNYGGFIW